MSPSRDFFVIYNNLLTEAHLWENTFQKNEKEVFWNVEIYPKGQNLQILKLKKQDDGNYIELYRDPKLKTGLNTVVKIIEGIKDL